MITFIASYANLNTFRALRKKVLGPLMPPTRAITYDQLFAARGLRAGTYVFTDFERLHPAEVRLASHIWRFYNGRPGFHLLNNPARVRTRLGLLKALKEAGINDFDAYPAESYPRPGRFPVFLRIASNHAGPIGGLIDSQQALERRLDELQEEGISLTGVLVVEFRAERTPEGLYEKPSVFRVGPNLALSAMLVGESWDVKRPDMNLVDASIMQRHLQAIRENRYAEQLRTAFDIAGIEYGRADLGFCDGRLQIYEINTNPSIHAGANYIDEAHRESREIFRRHFGRMMHEIDRPRGAAVHMDLGELDRPSRHRRQLARRQVPAAIAGLWSACRYPAG